MHLIKKILRAAQTVFIIIGCDSKIIRALLIFFLYYYYTEQSLFVACKVVLVINPLKSQLTLENVIGFLIGLINNRQSYFSLKI